MNDASPRSFAVQAPPAQAPRPRPAAALQAAVTPLAMGGALTLVAGFGIGLAAKAPDAFGGIAGFAFLAFAMVMAMHYFGNRV